MGRSFLFFAVHDWHRVCTYVYGVHYTYIVLSTACLYVPICGRVFLPLSLTLSLLFYIPMLMAERVDVVRAAGIEPTRKRARVGNREVERNESREF